MKKTIQSIGMALAISLTAGCSQPTLDTTNEETLKASIQEVSESLPEDERERFAKGVVGLYMMAAFTGFGGKEKAQAAKANLDERLHGKTADEVAEVIAEFKQKMNSKG